MDENQKRLRKAAEQLFKMGARDLSNIGALLKPYLIPDITDKLNQIMIDSESDVPSEFSSPMTESMINIIRTQTNWNPFDNYKSIEDIEREIKRMLYFKSMVETGAKYDLKNNGEWTAQEYRYNGKLYPNDLTGNVAFGYFGMAMGIPESILLMGAGAYQIYSDLLGIYNKHKKNPKNTKDNIGEYLNSWDFQKLLDFGDNPGDPEYIRIGCVYYKSRH